jgi:hypothetical protein
VGLLFVGSADLPFVSDYVEGSALAPRLLDAADPVVDVLNDRLGLDL